MSDTNQSVAVTDDKSVYTSRGNVNDDIKLKGNEIVPYKPNIYIEPNYFTIDLPWDNTEFVKKILSQISKRIGVTSIKYTNNDTEYTTLNITDSTQQIKRYYDVAQDYRRRYYKLLQDGKKAMEKIKKRTAQEVLDKISISNQEVFDHHQEKFNDIIKEMMQSYESKIESITKYFNNEIQIANDNEKNLEDRNRTLNYQLKKVQKELVILKNEGETSSVKTPKRDEITVKTPKIDENIKNDNNATTSANEQEQTVQFEINDLKETIRKKDNYIEQLLAQIRYLKDVNTEMVKQKKDLEFKIFDINKGIEMSDNLKAEQFKTYEKLILSAQKEIRVHQREANRLREHMASPNYVASPSVQPKKIIESNASDKKKCTPSQPGRTPKKLQRQLDWKNEEDTPKKTCLILEEASVSSPRISVKKFAFLTPESSVDNALLDVENISLSTEESVTPKPKKRGRPRKTPKK